MSQAEHDINYFTHKKKKNKVTKQKIQWADQILRREYEVNNHMSYKVDSGGLPLKNIRPQE